MKVISPLFDGPIDIVGDIHGEKGSLDRLLGQLGYDQRGFNPDGRRLVFVGDLVDRGPDSPGVVETVMRLVEAKAAQCILGNHELNLLLDKRKFGNEWFFDGNDSGPPMKPVSESQRTRFLAFFDSLPLALERDDLRIVHACWHEPSFEELKSVTGSGRDIAAVHAAFSSRIDAELADAGIAQALAREEQEHGHQVKYGHLDPYEHWPEPVMLEAHGRAAEIKQMGNPLKVLTSGIERRVTRPFPASGQFRFADRIKWWDEYHGEKPVIVGHYWRKFREIREQIQRDLAPDLFEGIAPDEFMGPRQNVYCVDFSVGLSAQKRAHNESTDDCSLAALRWPEEIVTFEDGTTKTLARRWSPDLYRAAWHFASKAHHGQSVPGQDYAYINHLGAVAMEVIACLERERAHQHPNLAVQCALLHDSIEDAGVTYDEIVETFGKQVADGVRALTKNPELKSKQEKMADSLERIRKQPREIWLVKLADRITNLQPPPAHWDRDKIENYRDEASRILAQLGEASSYLAARLRQAIRGYGMIPK